MCGIAGFSGQFDLNLLKEMTARIAHRGPDDSGIFFLENTIGLGHRRLSIIDLSKNGQQPMTVHCPCCQDNLWLIFNGELYNYQEIRTALIGKGHNFYSHTDSEVLLHLYAEEGVSMLNHLNGIFAFAIYDGNQNTLFLARDGLGVKPLYYSETKSGFLFASEIKSLLTCQEIGTHIDYTAIHYYLAYLWCPGQKTALQAIKKMEPGEAIIVKQGKISKQWFFYDIPYQGNRLNYSEKMISEKLYNHLNLAVKRQLVADVPIGAFLSGGLDSSAIVHMIKKLQPDKTIQTYCIGFNGGMISEGNSNDIPYAKAVANYLDVKLNVIEVSADIIKNLPKMLYYLDEPQADPAPINVYLIASVAKEHQIKVLLSGAGGDDLFSGYRRHQALYLEKVWKFLPIAIRNYLAKQANKIINGDHSLRLMNYPHFRRIAKVLSAANLSSDERIVQHFMWGSDHLRRRLYSQDMSAWVEHSETAEPLLSSLARIPNESDLLNRMLYLEGKHFLPSHNLNYTDKMSMALGIEVRVPFLDPDLVRFASCIPTHLKQKKLSSKAILKKAMAPYLPSSVVYRKKSGFGAPLRRWLHHELKTFVYDTLSEDSIKKRNIFNAKAVQKLIKWDKENRVDAAYTIFSILCIELWSTQFVDLRASREPSPLWI